MASAMFDAAYAPKLADVKAAGGIAMSCYLTGQYAATSPQPNRLHAAGLGALGNYERGAGELVACGYARGVEIGREAATAYIGKGAPAGQKLAIYFSVDVNAAPSTFPAIGRAFDGIKAGLAGRFVPRVYGEGALIDYLLTSKRVAGPQWLSASSSFPGFNPISPHVGLVQKVGTPVAGTDLDVITCDPSELGIWWPAGSPYLEVDPLAGYTLDQIAQAVVDKLIPNAYDGHPSVGGILAAIDEHVNDVEKLVKAVNTATAAPGGTLARLAAVQAQVAALAADVAAIKAGNVTVAPLVVSGTLTVGGKA